MDNLDYICSTLRLDIDQVSVSLTDAIVSVSGPSRHYDYAGGLTQSDDRLTK